ncbi:hypothetical protein PoB_001672400 [Plakobranchus ocellatus]|uniref:Uncharacterized protein n=1 Tax=Plakobranchus ocellatus TaxID=259542 RepID=A0AAV3Z8H3_9GAST|nr:hypothetical protein PoB_001672400 [Plakobranchus ocellatus]
MASPRPDGFSCTHGTCVDGICKNASAAATDIQLYASFSKQDRTGKGEFQGSYGSRLNSQAFDLLIMLPLLMLLDQCS